MRRLAGLFIVMAACVPLVSRAATCPSPIPTSDLITPGKLMLSINPTLPPQQFVDSHGELQGLNVELARDFAQRLCLEAEFIRMDFPGMFPALAASRFDGIDTGMFWTEERSKIVFTVPYAQQAISVVVLDSSHEVFDTPEKLSGHSTGVEINAYQERWVRAQDKALQAAGKPGIEVHAFTTATDVLAALHAGQVESAILIDQTAREIVRRGGVRMVGDGFGGAPTTLAFRKRSVAEAVAKTLTEMRVDGTYDKLFDKFGLTKLPDQVFAIRGPGPTAP
jgi:polar amino acid transport system substrate-binding protein